MDLPVDLPEGWEIPVLGVREKVDSLVESVKEKLSEEEEKAEQAFEGFK